ncbi:hypothetical protein FRB94_011730 [Tulasnella sp. JGI-2019a]|nr:hypothetical protein FRB94_011730 [Tulasnella sp. JGI-2019a]
MRVSEYKFLLVYGGALQTTMSTSPLNTAPHLPYQPGPLPGVLYSPTSDIGSDAENRFQKLDDQPSQSDLKAKLESKLPETVELLRQGRIASCNGAAVVAALFASVEATIISVLKGISNHEGSTNANRLMILLAYAALVLNASTTFTSLLLVDRLGQLPFMAIDREVTVTKTALKSGRRILGLYGAKGLVWDLVEYHYFFTLMVGGFCIFLQVSKP